MDDHCQGERDKLPDDTREREDGMKSQVVVNSTDLFRSFLFVIFPWI